MKKTIAILSLASIFFLSGCEETKSVSWWKEHYQDAKAKVELCSKSGDDSENCKNATQAVHEYEQLHAKPQHFESSDFPDVKLN